MVAYDSMAVIVWYLGEDCEEDGEETGTMLTGCMQNESVYENLRKPIAILKTIRTIRRFRTSLNAGTNY